jgi:hypothetical protein
VKLHAPCLLLREVVLELGLHRLRQPLQAHLGVGLDELEELLLDDLLLLLKRVVPASRVT